MKVQGKTIVVTGGGSGIGRELVLQLLQKGARVAATDIHEDSLYETRHLAGDLAPLLTLHRFDVANRASVEAFPQQVIELHGQVDGIINNAGIIQPFYNVADLNMRQIERIMNTNLYGTLYMVRAFLPYLLMRPEAHIVNVSSMGGFIPVPGQTVYCASKAAMKTLTEGLYAELLDTPVGVTVIHPGAVDTNIVENSGTYLPESNSDYPSLPANKAAEIIIDAMERRKFREMVGNDAKFLDVFYRITPKGAVHYIARKMKNLKTQPSTKKNQPQLTSSPAEEPVGVE